MKTFLKNYTSEVPVSITIGKIEAVLIRVGVSGITKEYGPQGEVCALTFHIALGDTRVAIRLPANREQALNALWENYKTTHPQGSKTRKDFAQQAERTAWKLMQDWCEVQLSLIQVKQAEFLEVFLPFVWDGGKRQTFYDRIKDGGYKALLTVGHGTQTDA